MKASSLVGLKGAFGGDDMPPEVEAKLDEAAEHLGLLRRIKGGYAVGYDESRQIAAVAAAMAGVRMDSVYSFDVGFRAGEKNGCESVKRDGFWQAIEYRTKGHIDGRLPYGTAEIVLWDGRND